MCEGKIVLDDIDKGYIAEIAGFIAKIEAGEIEVIKQERHFLGNGIKYLGEKITVEMLYTCKLCMHQMKDRKVCSITGKPTESICTLFEKIVE